MNTVEWIAAALGLANIALLVRRSVWNYPFGMAMVALYVAVFFEAKLYGEAGLQVFFFVAQGWSWVLWLRAAKTGGEGDDRVPVRLLSNLSRVVWLTATAALALNLGWVMHRFTDASLPYADTAIAGASIAAQILLAFRRIENWVLWIAVDIASIAVYVHKDLWATAGLYVVFLLMSVLALREWIVAYRTQA
ncbi:MULTISPECIES: nicotinamide riboside transporter PnuC [Sphingomonadaceae]|jgi:nicotinamide mononucleotide transporter|uniref:Nicotinamide riboside transporter PnuC n=1 Tax=Novosphingobium resinovorum TaxID=158500 RepID=A0A031JSW2_9SPHN|nr:MULTISPECIES: nicotinamide riboside transporter PnuC [Sphingomonadaceae]EJU12085.1 nicotinamide mononucleotide transporter [Sphingomonas sp. LH128]EZP79467.1 Nicotinamide mononucleotide transporter [Novosphingobium resinovorum]GLK43677.1 transporter [Novosphingobium resinovorum]